MDSYFMLCRPGFEADCAAEMDDIAGQGGMAGFSRARSGDGFLTWHAPGTELAVAGRPAPLFARTLWPVIDEFGPLPENNRIDPLLRRLSLSDPVQHVWLEHADTNTGRSLQRFLRGFRKALEARMRREGMLVPGQAGEDRVLHLFFHDSSHGLFGVCPRDRAAPWENGIPRLRLARSAPSRSALKLEEAMLRLLPESAAGEWLCHGRDAVDLGAAPGGWSWFLARRGLGVTAVDHGAMNSALLSDFPVTHVRADAFTWKPPASVDWVVCDVVDKPARTLALMGKWLRLGWARAACFNLKLPMKRRYAAVGDLLGRLRGASGPGLGLRAAHLYHDREEITVLAMPAAVLSGTTR